MEEIKHQELVNYKLEQIAVRLDKIDKKLDDGDTRYVSQREFNDKVTFKAGKDEVEILRQQVALLQKLMYGTIAAILLEFLRVVSSYFIKGPS